MTEKKERRERAHHKGRGHSEYNNFVKEHKSLLKGNPHSGMKKIAEMWHHHKHK